MDPASGVNLNNCSDIVQRIMNPCPSGYSAPDNVNPLLVVLTIVIVVAAYVFEKWFNKKYPIPDDGSYGSKKDPGRQSDDGDWLDEKHPYIGYPFRDPQTQES